MSQEWYLPRWGPSSADTVVLETNLAVASALSVAERFNSRHEDVESIPA